MTKSALSATIAGNTPGLRVAPLEPAVAGEAARLRAGGAGVVVLAAHAGGRCSRFDAPADLSSCDMDAAEIVDVIHRLPEGAIDVVVAGHTHAGMAHTIDGIGVIESFNAGRSFGRIDLAVDRRTGHVVTQHVFPPQDICARVVARTSRCAAGTSGVAARYENAPVVADKAIAAIVAPAIARVRDLKAAPLGVTLDTPIRRAPLTGAESPLGNLFTDAFLASRPDVDIAINNTSGGLRADLAAGPLTYGDIFEVFPFDNTLVRFSLTGAELRRVATAALRRTAPVPGIAGLSVHAVCRGTTLVVTLRRPSGALVTDAERLHVLTTDFLATGGDGIFAAVTPAGGFALEPGPLGRDVVAESLKRRGGHLRAEDLVDREHPRWTLPTQGCL
jgi:5'-nucleotidase